MSMAVNILGLTLLLLGIGSDIAIYVNVLASLSLISHSITVLHTVNNGFESPHRSNLSVFAPKKGLTEQVSKDAPGFLLSLFLLVH